MVVIKIFYGLRKYCEKATVRHSFIINNQFFDVEHA